MSDTNIYLVSGDDESVYYLKILGFKGFKNVAFTAPSSGFYPSSAFI